MQKNNNKYDIKSDDMAIVGNIPDCWEIKRLGFLFTFGKGLSITKKDLQDEGMPCVNYGEIHSKYGFEVNPEKNLLKYVDEKYLRTDRKSLIKRGDFLFADTSEDLEGSGNFTYLNSNEKIFAGYHTIILRLQEKIDYRYVAYLFDSIFFRTQIRNKVWGIKVYSITQPILKNAKMILPPPKEQQAIAAFLDTQCSCIDHIITEMEQQIEVLKQYKTSLITETVNNCNGIRKKNIRFKFIMSIKSGDTLTNELITDDETKYPVYGGGKLIGYYDRYNITTSNILIGRVGANCGCITTTEQNGWATDNALVVCPVCDKQYLYYLLIANNLNSINESNAQPLITATKVMNQKTAYVNSISEQQAIAAFLDTRIKRTDSIITEKRQSIETMKAYKKSLIYEYITGKKRVKGYS